LETRIRKTIAIILYVFIERYEKSTSYGRNCMAARGRKTEELVHLNDLPG
jgi:hypothetical protein